MSKFRRAHRHQQWASDRQSHPGVEGRAPRGARRFLRVPLTLGLGLAVLGVPSASLGSPRPAVAASVGTASVDLQQERDSQAELVKAALAAMAKRLAHERHEAWVVKQLAKRAAAYKALIASNRARYGATPD